MKTKLLLFIPCFLLLGHAAWADGDVPATETIPALITGQWATYSPSYNVTIPAKSEEFPVSVYVATYSGDITSATLTTQEINGSSSINVPAGSGLLLKTLSTTQLGPYSINTTSDPTVNLLETPYFNSLRGTGNTTPTVASLKYDLSVSFIMVLHKTQQTFVSYGSTGLEEVPANKAYLPITPSGPEARSIRIVEESEVITALDNSAEDAKTTKTIRNGQLYIRREGVTYDLMGRTIR